MENFGAFALLVALCVSLFAVVAAVTGRLKNKPFLILSSERAVLAVWALITTAAGILVYGLMTDDFHFGYVAAHSNRAMPTIYKFTAWWGGQEGSLLFWSWLLSTYAAVVVLTNRKRHRDLVPWVVAILSFVQLFFLLLNNVVANPFQVIAVGRLVTSVQDGSGLNPSLQYPAMAIHPPMLYLGYVGFAVPFAFAMASLITRQKGDAWIHTTRRWTIVTWLFQGIGIMLGSEWAYHVLGWGGYWAWDPVENASLLPWLGGTAYLHSVMMQEKKGMMKIWNVVLIASTFFLCIFGTGMTRSGVISSVHAFAQSSIGSWFSVFLGLLVAGTVYVILDRLPYLKSEARLESVVSRESSFLFNNLVLLASCFAVLWGTLFPIISEAIQNEKITLDPPWFNRLMIPIGLFLLFLTGVGPLFAWRRTSAESLRRNFLMPSLAGLALAAACFAFGMKDHPYAIVSFAFCLFVALTIFMEFFRGARAIAHKDGVNFARATVELTHRNTRRYGGYLVHMGIVLMFIGWTGQAFNLRKTVEVKGGETLSIGAYQLQVLQLRQGDTDNYTWDGALLRVTQDGKQVAMLEPERRIYKASQQPSSVIGLHARLNEDLYVTFAGRLGDAASLQLYVNPLVAWVWLGAVVLVFGTLVALVPSKVARSYPRTEVVGIGKKNVSVEA